VCVEPVPTIREYLPIQSVSSHMGIPDRASSYALSVRYDSAGGEDGTSKIENPNSSFLNRRETLLMSLSYRTACWVDLRIKNDE